MDIDKILLKVMNDEASREEYEAIEQWKSESQENLNLLQELAVGANKGTSYDEYDKNTAWEKVHAQITPTKDTTPAPNNSRSNTIWYTLALAAVVAIAGYFLYPQGEKRTELYKADNAVMAFALEDNSSVWLRDGGSTLSLKSDFQTERRVALEGEAFFDIASDKDRPFIIEVANGDFIKVLGTSFNVINSKKEFDLTVYSGRVELHTLNRVLTLTKGDKVTRVNGAMVKIKDNKTNQLSWKNKELIFENSSLDQVFLALESHYKTNIQVESDGTIASCKIRTRYTKEPISKVMKELADQFGFQYNIQGKNISVFGLSCK